MNRYLFLLFVCLLGLCGCGSSNDESYVFTSSPASARTTTVELRNILAQTAIPSYITTIRGTGFDASGERIYGPQSKAKAATVQWTEVPVETRTFLFEFLGANDVVLGNATVTVQLVESEVYVVDDLVVSFGPDPTPAPPANLRVPSNQSYQFDTDTGVITPPLGGSSNPSGWNNETKEFELETFTLETGAVLNVSGNTALSIRVEGDVVLDGTLNFAGADGEDGADTEPSAQTAVLTQSVGPNITSPVTGVAGGNGASGGVTIASFGEVSGSGAVFSRGGNGGNGGSVKFSTDQTTISSAITGGRGGNGGSPGLIKFVIRGTTTDIVTGITATTSAGNGGKGGNVEFLAAVYTGANSSVNGGRGGDSTEFGGSGGRGGSLLVISDEQLFLGGTLATGAGGNGEVYGGHGGDATFSGFNSQIIGTLTCGAGGSGGTQGGNGGSLNFSGQFAGIGSSTAIATAGAGGSSGHQGGYGGYINFTSQWSANYGSATGGAGGQGGTQGGDGGTIIFEGQYGFNNTNAFATGGAGGAGGSVGGDGGHVYFLNLNAGTATGGSGGDATVTGGGGGFVTYYPNAVEIPGSSSNGGLGGSPSGSNGGVVRL